MSRVLTKPRCMQVYSHRDTPPVARWPKEKPMFCTLRCATHYVVENSMDSYWCTRGCNKWHDGDGECDVKDDETGDDDGSA